MKNIGNALTDDAHHYLATGGGLTSATSSADYFPKVVELQKRIGASGFVVVTTSKIAGSQSPVKIIMSNSSFERDQAANDVLDNMSHVIVSHVRKSSIPVFWRSNMHEKTAMEISRPARLITIENAGISGLGFPVHLGDRQSGMAVFFAPSIAITSEMQLDIHRKIYAIARELLKLESSAKGDNVPINAREAECLQHAGNGMTSDDIAEHLSLSVHTVNAHLGSATNKLDSVNRIQAIAKAIRLGLIS